MIQVKDIYWAARFIDGEGSTGIVGQNKHGIMLHVPQNDRQLLDRLVNLFGGTVVGPYNASGPYKDKLDCLHYEWILCGHPAISVLMTIYPIMSNKRKLEYKTIIEYWRSFNNTSTTSKFRTHCKNGHKWIQNNMYTDKRGYNQCKLCSKVRSLKRYYNLKKEVLV